MINWKCSKCGGRKLAIVLEYAIVTREVLGVKDGEVLYGEPEIAGDPYTCFECATCGMVAPEIFDDEDIIELYGEVNDNNEGANSVDSPGEARTNDG